MSHAETAAASVPGPRHAAPERWVFGYGSLMWRPGFDHQEAVPATLAGFRRCFCVYSTHHRGTPRRHGLVLGLDRGGSCHGMALRVAESDWPAVIAYLRAREQVNGVYREAHLPVWLEGQRHREVTALAFIVERAHPSYTGALSLERQRRLIRGAAGLSGANADYLISTLRQLSRLGIRDRELERLAALIGPHLATRPIPPTGSSAGARALLAATRGRRIELPRVSRLGKGERRRFVHRMQLALLKG